MARTKARRGANRSLAAVEPARPVVLAPGPGHCLEDTQDLIRFLCAAIERAESGALPPRICALQLQASAKVIRVVRLEIDQAKIAGGPRVAVPLLLPHAA